MKPKDRSLTELSTQRLLDVADLAGKTYHALSRRSDALAGALGACATMEDVTRLQGEIEEVIRQQHAAWDEMSAVTGEIARRLSCAGRR